MISRDDHSMHARVAEIDLDICLPSWNLASHAWDLAEGVRGSATLGGSGALLAVARAAALQSSALVFTDQDRIKREIYMMMVIITLP